MARLPEFEILYKTFHSFADLCLINNKSILWPDKEIWTPENVGNAKKRMVDTPILGQNLSFEEKLQIQMQNAPPELWGIICDVYFLYFMPSSFIKLTTKQKDIAWAAEQGCLNPPSLNSDIWNPLKSGFTHTGQKYHLKYCQFWLILIFALFIKGLQNRSALLSSSFETQKALDSILDNLPRTDRAYDMRHAILYMAFPDLYERVISTKDKETILNTYRKKLSLTLPLDTDAGIQEIRKVLAPKFDMPDRPFDFYRELKEEWKPGKKIPGAAPVEIDDGVVIVPDENENKAEAEGTEHTKIQWMLLKLGNDMGLDVWVAKNDRNKEIEGRKFIDLPHLKKELPLALDEVSNRTIQMIDVVWLKGNAIKAAFEIESTTSIYSGILRLADLISMQPYINIPLFIVAPDDRRNKVIVELNRPVFSKLPKPMSEICRFISFSSLKHHIVKIGDLVKFISPDFLDEISESCEIEEKE